MKKLIVVLAVLFCFTGCGKTNTSTNTSEDKNTNSTSDTDSTTPAKLVISDIKEPNTATEGKNYPIATITLVTGEVMEVELNPDEAPNTVNNFISLANSGFYNNLIFHRVINGFMDQAGDPSGDGSGGPGYTIDGEFSGNGSKNTLLNTEGTIAMARTSDPNSAGSQFYINVADNTSLDGQYAVFGKVIKGYNIAVAISLTKRDSNDKPINPVTIKTITVDTKGVTYSAPKENK